MLQGHIDQSLGTIHIFAGNEKLPSSVIKRKDFHCYICTKETVCFRRLLLVQLLKCRMYPKYI